MKTYTVSHNGGSWVFHACHACDLREGRCVIYRMDEVVAAFAPGAWDHMLVDEHVDEASTEN